MELEDLNEKERVALVALLLKVVVADRDLTDCEGKELSTIIDALGEDAYRSAVNEADSSFRDDADLKASLETISRREARDLIFGTAMNVAMADTISPQEAPLLEWLAKTWRIDVKPARASGETKS